MPSIARQRERQPEPEWITAERQLRECENWVYLPKARSVGKATVGKYVRCYGLDGARYPRVVLAVDQHYDGTYGVGAAKKMDPKDWWQTCRVPAMLLPDLVLLIQQVVADRAPKQAPGEIASKGKKT